ncbi:oxygen-insensitive NADPH nitroreductase [Halalkalibacillus halophilus]|uniref:oxygen-insensitive NADPH nitroreductase n=1 Tax=Halalkalibacillus halophilus TaxID=392827 RepID=UPI0004086530|nr:oxygen-insensitive NADPH nitroreductase [Halalkalibacillus halophilus]
MNTTIEQILNHRSIRQFKDKKLSSEQIETIISAGQAASTSSYYQAYSIIGITDPEKKQALKEVSGQQYVENNGHLFVFCADLQRIYQSQPDEIQSAMRTNLQSTEFFMMSVIDATLAAQNCALASESMGLGICYLGSLRNDIQQVNDLLELPYYVTPLFGLAVGVPKEDTDKKPRLPFQSIYHENVYVNNQEAVEAFDETTKEYYQLRGSNTREDTWSSQIGRKLKTPMRMDVASFIQSKNLNKH